MAEKILIVDDEESIVTLLDYHFKKAGYEVLKAMDGEEGLQSAITYKPDLLVLDLMLPMKDGLEVCKELKFREEKAAIIMLTANDDPFEKVLALELGADDYMTKPFSPREVVARVKSILRRMQLMMVSNTPDDSSLTVGNLTLIPEKYEAYLAEEKLELTKKEYDILLQLVKNKGKLVTRETLYELFWANKLEGDSRIVDIHISHIREKIKSDENQMITTIRGLGYKMNDSSLPS